ncbi:hypothetical protein [Oceanospirillum sanctuarii]|uniref:hypothetical protein n=1 Tax=Oceanospirillum sanctuarii TaxID=1434821 RepID=UPI000A3B7EF1|nr:hypothetical protein [Oceanospirillum sanctuarii]
MIWHLLAAFSAGLAAAGIALILRKLSRGKLPKWFVPAFAGAGMLAYQINMDYGWYGHKLEKLPSESVVVSSEAPGKIWRPWTYIFPMTSAFTVLDSKTLNTRVIENQRIAEFALYRFEKHYTDRVANNHFVLNCDTRELLPVSDKGALEVDKKQLLLQSDRLLSQACL